MHYSGTHVLIGVILASTIFLSGCGLFSAIKDEVEIEQGYNAASKAPIKHLPHKLTTFACGEHKFEIMPPDKFGCSELTQDFGKVFVFGGEKNANGRAPALSIMVIVPQEGQSLPSDGEVIDTDLAPFESHMTDFIRNDKKSFSQNGIQFEGATFSGTFPDQSKIKGLVYSTHHKGVAYSFFASAPKESFDTANETFTDVFKTFKFVD